MLGIGCPDRHALQRITSPKLRRPRRLLPSRERVRSPMGEPTFARVGSREEDAPIADPVRPEVRVPFSSAH